MQKCEKSHSIWAHFARKRLRGTRAVNYVGAIDQGTTSTRFMVFDKAGAVVCAAQKEHEQIFPAPGWVEHNAEEILHRTYEVIAEALTKRGLKPGDLAGIGITNQRETTIVWERATGKRSEEHTSELQSRFDLVCRLLLEKKKTK